MAGVDSLGLPKYQAKSGPHKYSVDYSRFADIPDDDDDPPKRLRAPSSAEITEKKAQLEAAELASAEYQAAVDRLDRLSKEEQLGEDKLGGTLGDLKSGLGVQLDSLQKQMDTLSYHEHTLSMLSNPMELAKYLEAQGCKDDEIERAMDGDESVMRAFLEKQLKLPLDKERLEEDFKKVEALSMALSAENKRALKDAADVVGQRDDSRKHTAVLQGAAAVKEKENRSSFSFGTANKALSQRTVPRDAQATDEVEREFVLPQTPGAAPPIQSQPSPAGAANNPFHSMEVMGSELVVLVELPGLTSMQDAVLEITDTELLLDTTDSNKYSLRIQLPRPVDPGPAKAKFSKKTQSLKIFVPLR
mmetsp:Transcript_26098/g.49571  ORF Transcript_26098/g.49571 Transcript_26098/m.49571 type:complete len:360 (-) Transcript_26098:359-1438(-)|eukprot:CAMPEP_0114238330 /NCGR_PEP_ID=MMETSP0058-20121206/7869_1 /TAXON_ID=36894 /ORGANISM="Pyramimonas parkeae, CCMP726" /LENGTH=359 /DNA_ID=CAMNT_0001350437 /DNA_START=21 /DNA_END=1100 /DNA_ORIENTATION=-